MKASELAEQIEQVEGIRVCVVAPNDVDFDPYPYKRKAKGNITVTDFKNDRLAKAAKSRGQSYSVEIFDKNNLLAHGNTQLDNLR